MLTVESTARIKPCAALSHDFFKQVIRFTTVSLFFLVASINLLTFAFTDHRGSRYYPILWSTKIQGEFQQALNSQQTVITGDFLLLFLVGILCSALHTVVEGFKGQWDYSLLIQTHHGSLLQQASSKTHRRVGLRRLQPLD